MKMIVLLAAFLLLTVTREVCSVTLTITPVRANVTVLTGKEKVQLNCTTDIPVENISWTYNGNSLPQDHATVTGPTDIVLVSTLTLINPAPSKSGEYSCFVPLVVDSAPSDPATLNIQAPIYLVNSNQKITAFVGDTVAMQVSSFGLGQHTFQWTRRGRNKHIKADATGVDSTQLILPNVSMDDNGRYFFSASSQWSTNQTRVDLRVTYPPADIVEHPQNYSSFLSLSATFHCNGSSSFPVTYSWRRVNSSLNITEQATGHNSSTLVILRTQHSDEGWYQCVTSVFGVESFSDPAYLVVKEPPAPRDLKSVMNLEQNKVFLNWTRPDSEIFSTDLTLSYRLYYTTRGACVMSQCQARLCRVQRRIRSRFDSIMFTQELFPFTNYTWLLELNYTNDGSPVQYYNISVDVQTSQSAASAPVNLTVLNESFQWVNLTWSAPQCPNGIISNYRVYYNNSYKDVQYGMDYYILTGLRADSIYNISVAAITGVNNDIIGDSVSVISKTPVGPPLIEPQSTTIPVLVDRDVTSRTMTVHTPVVRDERGEISFVYILVSTDGLVKPDKSIVSLPYREATDSGLVYYVAAALSYNEYSDSNTFILGDGKRTVGLNGQQFTNVKLNTDTTYYYFIRAYSADYSEENELVNTSALYEIGSLSSVGGMITDDDDDSDSDDDDFPVTIAIALLAGLIAMIIVLVCIIICCCCYIISKNNKRRKHTLKTIAQATKKLDVEDPGLSDNTSTNKAVSNDYADAMEISVTDKNCQQYAKLHQNNGSASNTNGRDLRESSGSSCSVTSAYANDINPALGILEKTANNKSQGTSLPTQGAASEKSTPKKESKHSWFSLRSKRKSKNEGKSPDAGQIDNPLFDQKHVGKEETGYANVEKEVTDNREEESGYTEVIRDALQATNEPPAPDNMAKTEAPEYSNVTKTTADAEEVPGYGNVTVDLSHTTLAVAHDNPQTTSNSSEENALAN